MIRNVVASFVIIVILLFGYPAAAIITHGYNFQIWPADVAQPSLWWGSGVKSWGMSFYDTYRGMLSGRSAAFVGGGLREALVIVVIAGLATGVVLTPKLAGPRRDPSRTYGDARFATPRERSRMSSGLELGLDPFNGRPIRVAVKGNLVSIAPPRTGKTSGLLIPNLAAPENAAWFGPAVVLDPKGEAFRATAARRRALGRKVHCLDPMSIVGGMDSWNPLAGLDLDDILYLQRLARALLPDSPSSDNRYFQDRAVDTVVAGFLAARQENQLTPLRVSQLLSDPDRLAATLKGLTAEPARKTVALLNMDPKTRDAILSTAQQGFQWCDDTKLQKLTARSTFELTEVCRGEADLFITIPTENLRTLAPLIRWLLTDLFTAIRRNKPAERVVIFIDEARVLGRFGEIVEASGELPGSNASLWTFWQDRSQLISTYGDADAKTLLATAEFTTFSDPAMVDPSEREHWSTALGDYTILEEATSSEPAASGKPSRTTTSRTPKAVRLMPAEALSRLPTSDLIVLPNSPLYEKRPMQIRKTRHDDSRLAGLTTSIGATAGAART